MTRPTEQLRACLEGCRLPKTQSGINRMACCCCCVMVAAWTLILIAIAVPIYLNNTLDKEMLRQGVMDSKSAPQWESWSGTGPNGPAGMNVALYVYDYLNPQEILDGGLPAVAEMGPFVYKQYQKVIEVNWTADATEMSFKRYSYYVFQPDLSVGDPMYINITSINMPFVALRQVLQPPDNAQIRLGNVNNMQKMFTSRSIHEIIFGYDDAALKFMHKPIQQIPERYPGVLTNHTSEADAWRLAKPDAFYTGVGDITRIREMIMYQQNVNLTACQWQPCNKPPAGFVDTWGTREASVVSGHDGGAWAPGIRASDTLTMWVGSFMRPIDFTYVQTSQLKGVSVYEYEIAPYELEVGGRNSVYYQNTYRGLFNISSVLSGVPTYMSKPRFLDADPALKAQARFFFTDNEDKQTTLYVEPRSGFALGGLARAQLNVEVGPLYNQTFDKPKKIYNVTWFGDMVPAILPVFWAEVNAQIDDSGAQKWVDQVYGAIALIKLARYVGAIGGSLLLAISVVGLTWVRYHRKGKGEPITSEADTGAHYADAAAGNGHGGSSNGALPLDSTGNDLGSASVSVADPSDRLDAAPPAQSQSGATEGTSLLSAAAPMPGSPVDPAFSPMPNRAAGVADVALAPSYHN